MPAKIIRVVNLLTLLTVFLFSCKKNDEVVNPKPIPPIVNNQYQFVIALLPGEPATGTTGLYAMVMVINEKNETILDHVKLPLHFDGQYKSNKLELPAGKYKVVKFLVNNELNKTRFAAPITGSTKASEVNKPLYVSFDLPQQTISAIPVEVLRLTTGDTPESYGYSAGSFDRADPNPIPDQGNPFFKLKLRAYAQVGDIYYDSIPATVTLSIVHNSGQTTRQQITLAAGTNIIDIPKAAHKYEFEFSKWGIHDLVVLNRDQIREESVYGIGGRIAAKKLKQIMTYRFINGSYVPESKVEYSYYNGNGQLHQTDYYEKGANGLPVLAYYESFAHNTDNKITRIGKYTSNHVYQGDVRFLYNSSGKQYAMVQNEGGVETTALVTYFQTPGRENAHIKYTYSHNANEMDYNLVFDKGNLIESSSATSNQNSAIGLYQYDLNINPFIHLGRPDLFLSNQSKNNVVSQQKQFNGSYPNAYPYRFDYSYDNDGYPKEVVTGYLNPISNTHSYTLKTVYTYL